jgi:hypothetical protein
MMNIYLTQWRGRARLPDVHRQVGKMDDGRGWNGNGNGMDGKGGIRSGIVVESKLSRVGRGRSSRAVLALARTGPSGDRPQTLDSYPHAPVRGLLVNDRFAIRIRIRIRMSAYARCLAATS